VERKERTGLADPARSPASTRTVEEKGKIRPRCSLSRLGAAANPTPSKVRRRPDQRAAANPTPSEVRWRLDQRAAAKPCPDSGSQRDAAPPRVLLPSLFFLSSRYGCSARGGRGVGQLGRGRELSWCSPTWQNNILLRRIGTEAAAVATVPASRKLLVGFCSWRQHRVGLLHRIPAAASRRQVLLLCTNLGATLVASVVGASPSLLLLIHLAASSSACSREISAREELPKRSLHRVEIGQATREVGRNFTEKIMREETEKESMCWGRIQILDCSSVGRSPL
jgi:hypothetical protein